MKCRKNCGETCKKLVAEFIATAVLVFAAIGSVLFALHHGAPMWAVTIIGALAFGLVIVAMAYAIGPVSGAHLNPAVSLGIWISGRMKATQMLLYMAAQTVGAIFGAFLLWLTTSLLSGDWGWLEAGFNAYGGLAAGGVGASIGLALIIETLLTFIFVFTIIMVTSRMQKHEAIAGLVIGLTLTLVHLVGIPLTGTSVNPARSIGPAIFGGLDALKEVWLFIVAPLAGAALAAVVAKCLLCVKKKEEEPAEVAKPVATEAKKK
jgi:aquaporin Z